ncbi:MAG: PTS sugar transporter subunit IIA [Planctomycetota bacterium]
MRFSQLLKPEYVLLELETNLDPEIDYSLDKNVLLLKESVFLELSHVFDKTGKVTNRNKLYVDLLNREKKASTGIGKGVAIPHVRTIQIREISMVIARSIPGIPFDAIDHEPVHLFIALVCPPYADQFYLKFFKKIAQMLETTTLFEDIMTCETEDEVVRSFLKAAE